MRIPCSVSVTFCMKLLQNQMLKMKKIHLKREHNHFEKQNNWPKHSQFPCPNLCLSRTIFLFIQSIDHSHITKCKNPEPIFVVGPVGLSLPFLCFLRNFPGK